MTPTLLAHLSQISKNLESLHTFAQEHGSDEQQQLISAMCQTVNQALAHYQQPIPTGHDEDFFLWRHEAIRPVSLCINSAELLLTDEEYPLETAQRTLAQEILDCAMTMTDQINAIADRRIAQ